MAKDLDLLDKTSAEFLYTKNFLLRKFLVHNKQSSFKK
jgi:hypothetical protein